MGGGGHSKDCSGHPVEGTWLVFLSWVAAICLASVAYDITVGARLSLWASLFFGLRERGLECPGPCFSQAGEGPSIFWATPALGPPLASLALTLLTGCWAGPCHSLGTEVCVCT